MVEQQFLKGSQLFALARKKAAGLGVQSKGSKLEPLILMIQEKEGHSPCFRRKEKCVEGQCCWQASCGAIV